MTKYTIALASHGAVHNNGSLAIVFIFEITIFTKNNTFIDIYFCHAYAHNSEVYILDKPFDDHSVTSAKKKDENKVIKNAHIHVNLLL